MPHQKGQHKNAEDRKKTWPYSHAFSASSTNTRIQIYPAFCCPLSMNHWNMLSTCSDRSTDRFLSLSRQKSIPGRLPGCLSPRTNGNRHLRYILSGNLYFALFSSPTMLNINNLRFRHYIWLTLTRVISRIVILTYLPGYVNTQIIRRKRGLFVSVTVQTGH